MNFKTYEDLTNCIINNLHKVPRDIDLIIGIPRSGTMVANILSLYLNVPFMDIDSFLDRREFRTGSTRKCENWIKSILDAKHVLIVDDSISSGKAMKEARKLIEESGIICKFTYMAIYTLFICRKKVDIYFEICEQPRMFEWNFMHHWALEYCCMDIDGILCEDPSRAQNDDGKNYIDFLKNAPPKFIPTHKIGALVSCRLEKYRKETVDWLEKYRVEYDKLILLDGISAKERALMGNHAEYKAQKYNESGNILFFESDYDQALEICKISGKPVFCTTNRCLVHSNNVIKKISVRNKEFIVTIKRIIKKLFKKIKYIK